MKKNMTYTVHLVIEKTSADITYAECGCAAGLGPAGSCKHIAAMCYALEDFSRIRQLRDHVSCTSQLQQWNQPRKQQLDPRDVNTIKFVKLEHGKSNRSNQVVPYDPRPVSLRGTSLEEIQTLKDKLLMRH